MILQAEYLANTRMTPLHGITHLATWFFVFLLIYTLASGLNELSRTPTSTHPYLQDMEHNYDHNFNASATTMGFFGYGPAKPYPRIQHDWQAFQSTHTGSYYRPSTAFQPAFQTAEQPQDGAHGSFLSKNEMAYWDEQPLGPSNVRSAANDMVQDSLHESTEFDPSGQQPATAEQTSCTPLNWTDNLLEDYLNFDGTVQPGIPSGQEVFDHTKVFGNVAKDDLGTAQASMGLSLQADSWLTSGRLAEIPEYNDGQVQKPQEIVGSELSAKLNTVTDYTSLWNDLDYARFSAAGCYDPDGTDPMHSAVPGLEGALPSTFDFSFDPPAEKSNKPNVSNLPFIPNIHMKPELSEEWKPLRPSQPSQHAAFGLEAAPVLIKSDIAAHNSAVVHQSQYPLPSTQFPAPRLVEIENVQAVGTKEINRDQFLLDHKARGYTYKQIRRIGGFKEAESTLRGRYRSLTKTREERVRKPTWDRFAVECLKEIVGRHLRDVPGFTAPITDHAAPLAKPRAKEWMRAMTKVPWKLIAEEMHGRGCYRYGNSTVKKKFMEVIRLTKK